MSLPVRMLGLNMNGQPDGDGDVFVVTDVEGLHSPGVELGLTQKHGDGARVDRFRFTEKTLRLRGKAYSRPNQAFDVLRLRRKLHTNSYPLGPGLLYVDEPEPKGRPVQLEVYRSDELDLPPPSYNVQEFSIPLTAPDPRLYSQTLTTVPINGGPIVVNHTGSVPTYVVATLTANRTAPYLQHDLQGRLTLAGATLAGTQVDFLNRKTVHPSNGVVNLVLAGSRTWWSLYPGNNSIRSNGPFDLAYRVAWL